jgi:hypothetical protein
MTIMIIRAFRYRYFCGILRIDTNMRINVAKHHSFDLLLLTLIGG